MLNLMNTVGDEHGDNIANQFERESSFARKNQGQIAIFTYLETNTSFENYKMHERMLMDFSSVL